MSNKFRTKLTEIEAVQLTWPNWNKICEFVPKPWFLEGCFTDGKSNVSETPKVGFEKLGLKIKTLESNIFVAKETDWIIKGLEGEFYACDDRIFNKKYEKVED